MNKRILNVIGARPNFMKMAPIHKLMLKHGSLQPLLLHTGQHYDAKMSKVFFDDLQLPQPDVYLGVGSGTHAVQTAQVMLKVEQVMLEHKPDLVVVVGDVNSTLAASIVAAKLWIPVAHVEAGLRSFDREMPEEINRILTDTLAELLFVTEKSGEVNLLKEGIAPERIHLVGNVMIDSLLEHREKARASTILQRLEAATKEFALITLHRPSNVDTPKNLGQLLDAFEVIQRQIKLLFPIHPRTLKMLDEFGLKSRIERMKNLLLLEPIGYLDFLKLMDNAAFILTDSGGIQEESTVLNVPCLTLRENTERPITIEQGSNILVGTDADRIIHESLSILSGHGKHSRIPPLWDGQAAERIVRIIEDKIVSSA